MAGIKTYPVSGGWVMSDPGGWCPGLYDSADTARYAHRLGFPDIETMWSDWINSNILPAPAITRADVRAWKIKKKES